MQQLRKTANVFAPMVPLSPTKASPAGMPLSNCWRSPKRCSAHQPRKSAQNLTPKRIPLHMVHLALTVPTYCIIHGSMSNKRIFLNEESFALPVRICETLAVAEKSHTGLSGAQCQSGSRRAKATSSGRRGLTIAERNLAPNSKANTPRMSICDAVYTAINRLDGGSEQEVIKLASKMCGKSIERVQFKRALASFDSRGVSS